MATLKAYVKFYLYDYIGVICLAIVYYGIHQIQPFQRFVSEFWIQDLSFPLKDSSVPDYAVPIVAIGVPALTFVAFYAFRRQILDLHHGVLGLLYAFMSTGAISEALKVAIGRPRPDFFWRCFPDGNGVYDNATHGVLCTGNQSTIIEGYRSFPSSHASLSFAGLGYLSFYLAGKIQVFNHQGHAGKLIIISTPLLIASIIAITRLDDYWHHWQDLLVGIFVGLLMAYTCYRQHFHKIQDPDYPYAPSAIAPSIAIAEVGIETSLLGSE